MKIQLLEHFQSFLLRTPPYTSTFLLVQEWTEPVLVMRVEELALFQQEGYRTRVSFWTWQNAQGTWVVAVPFRLEGHPQPRVSGMPCLNPRHTVDYAIMQKFSTEGRVRFLFLSADLNDVTDIQIPWPPPQRLQVQRIIQAIDHTLTGKRLTSVFDPDFEQARQEFQTLLATAGLLGEVWAR